MSRTFADRLLHQLARAPRVACYSGRRTKASSTVAFKAEATLDDLDFLPSREAFLPRRPSASAKVEVGIRRPSATAVQGRCPMHLLSTMTSTPEVFFPPDAVPEEAIHQEGLDSKHAPERLAQEAARPFMDMPGPLSLPIVGTMWMHLPGGPLHGLSFEKKMERLRDTYGPIVRERVLLNFQMVHVFRPEDIETVYRLEGARPRREGFRMLQKYNDKYNDGIQGIITSHGEVWHRLRSKTQGRLLKPKSVAAYLNIHNGVADDLLASIRRLRNTDGIIDNLLPELYKFAMEGIGYVCFNRRVGALEENIPADSDTFRFIEAVNDVMTVSQSENKSFFLSEWSSEFKKLRRAQTFIKEMSTRQALQTLEMLPTNELQLDSEGGDLIRYLMTKTDLRQAEVLTVISEFFFAGVDTTSHLLGFALYALAQNPEVQEKLIEEIDRVTDGSDVISTDMLGRMPYLKAVTKETFRVTPITPGNGRTLDNDIVLSGYHVPAGIMFGLHHDVACKSPQYVSEPDRFLPERWLRGGSGDLGTIHPFVLVPFGFGPRSCVGRRLAEQEYSLGLIKILQKFRVEYAHNENLNYTMSIINTPTTPLKFRFLERK